MKKLKYILLLLCYSCYSNQYRLDYDKEKNSVITCNENIKIKNVTIKIKSDPGVGYKIFLRKGLKGNNIIYLNKWNLNYETNVSTKFFFKPNTEYILYSTFLDSSVKMELITDSLGIVKSIFNPFNCN